MKSMKGTGDVKRHKTSPMGPTPLGRTAKGLAGNTPVGRTGDGNRTREGMGGRAQVPSMRPGGRKQNHTVPVTYNFPAMTSATVAHGMGALGAQDGGMFGINPPFTPGKVSGKKAQKKKGL